MSLINLKTDLKSLKYGKDTPGGGDSGQPYIKTDINNVDKAFNQLRLTKFDDGLIRGGAIGALNASVVDTIRIGKFLTDFPKGPLFIAKQVGLQLSNPKLEVRKVNIGNGRGILGFVNRVINDINSNIGPTRIYNLGLNTIAQVPVNAFGQHFNRHGLLPVQNENTKYLNVAKENNENGNNRLVGLKNKLIGVNTSSTILNRNKLLNTAFNILSNLGFNIPYVGKLNEQQLNIDDYIGGPGSVYGIGKTIIRRYDFTGVKDKNKISFSNDVNINNEINLSILQGLNPDGPSLNYPEENTESRFEFGGNVSSPNTITYKNPVIKTYQDIKNSINEIKNYNHTIPTELQYKFYNLGAELSPAPDKFNSNPELIISKGDKENKFKYNDSLKTAFNRNDSSLLQVVFRIITSNKPGGDQINLSAYISGFKDNFNAIWNEINYNGRSDSFYIYNKGKREVSFNLQIPCFNVTQLFEKHRALGQLASTTAGTYNNDFLQGVLFKLNVGNYLVGEYAILNNISYSIPENATWDVDNKLAQYIDASFSFTIIHKDLPQYQPNQGFFKYLYNPLKSNDFVPERENEDQDTVNKIAENFAVDYASSREQEQINEDNRRSVRPTQTQLQSVGIENIRLGSQSNPITTLPSI